MLLRLRFQIWRARRRYRKLKAENAQLQRQLLDLKLSRLAEKHPELGRRMRRHQEALDQGQISHEEYERRATADLTEYMPREAIQ